MAEVRNFIFDKDATHRATVADFLVKEAGVDIAKALANHESLGGLDLFFISFLQLL